MPTKISHKVRIAAFPDGIPTQVSWRLRNGNDEEIITQKLRFTGILGPDNIRLGTDPNASRDQMAAWIEYSCLARPRPDPEKIQLRLIKPDRDTLESDTTRKIRIKYKDTWIRLAVSKNRLRGPREDKRHWRIYAYIRDTNRHSDEIPIRQVTFSGRITANNYLAQCDPNGNNQPEKMVGWMLHFGTLTVYDDATAHIALSEL